MQDIDAVIDEEIKVRSKQLNGEWLLSFDDALKVIEDARKASIAVLGVESFQTMPDGIKVLNYSGYGHEDKRIEWEEFVGENYREAIHFVTANKLSEGYVYILTTTSKSEFESLESKS